MFSKLLLFFICALAAPAQPQVVRKLEKFNEVFAWKQLTFDIDGVILSEDRDDDPSQSRSFRRTARQAPVLDLNSTTQTGWRLTRGFSNQSEEGRYFIKYNNVPMGMEKVGNRLFVTIPRRRYGIPSTLNYIDLNRPTSGRSPPLKPYPNVRQANRLMSVYRTRADQCGRLWMVDTGMLELPSPKIQYSPPAIVIFDLNTDTMIHRYELKASDLPSTLTPTGLASITVDITNNACDDAYAYIPDLTTFGLIVYSLRQNDSWRHAHNYFSFNPLAGNLRVADQYFQWSDGVFSVVLLPGSGGCKRALFHSLIGTHEFAVSTCLLKNRTAISDSNYFAQYDVVGSRGEMTQSTMHDYHPNSNVMFFADIGRDAVSCWNTGEVLSATHVGVLARDTRRMSYPSDLHVTDNEVWVMANTLPRFGYSRLDTNEYNFYIYRGNVYDLISGTVCGGDSNRIIFSD